MDRPPPESSGKGFLQRYPAALLVVPTLSLLLGQALYMVSRPWILTVLFLVLLVSFLLARRRLRRWSLLVLFSSLAFWVGFSMHEGVLRPDFPKHHLARQTDGKTPLYVEGVFYREPKRLTDRSRWYLRVERIWRPFGAEETAGKVLMTVRETRRDWRYGDRVRLRARIRAPRPAANPGGFEYRAYLARRGIHLVAFLETDSSVELLHRETGGFWSRLQALRGRIRRSIDASLPGREGAVLKALVIGDRAGLSRQDRERFAASGVAHLLSISGLHVGMLGLAAFLMARTLGSFSATLMLRWNLLKAATVCSFLAALFYTGLSGGRIPTIRAAIMVAVYGLAVLLDREEEFYSSLALAALVIGLVWPGVVFDVSFQLSFLAVLFIIWGLRRIQELRPEWKNDPLEPEPAWFRLWLPRVGIYLVVPVLATLGTGPLVAHHFGRVSLAGFLANPILVPLVGFLLVPLGFLIGFLSLFFVFLAAPMVWVAKPLVSITLFLVDWFAEMPKGSLSVPKPGPVELGVIYLMICGLLVVRRRKQLSLLLTGVLAAIVLDGAYWWGERWNRVNLRITYLSVGQGDAAVVEFPGSQVLLIDAGGSGFSRFDPGKSIVVPYLQARRIATLDYVLVSHPRIDHYGGLQSVIAAFSPREFWSNGFGSGSTRYRELQQTVSDLGIAKVVLTRGEKCRSIDGVQLCVLYPPAGLNRETSVVLRLRMGRFHFLFPGDIRMKGEEQLVGSGSELSSHIVKVPRHGSKSSSSGLFVSAVRPKLAIFSVGRGRRLPSPEVLARYEKHGARILRTDQDGAITLETDGRKLVYWTHLSGKSGKLNSAATVQ